MELKEYLEKSRAKRAGIIKLADKFFNTTLSREYNIASEENESPDHFPGPSPFGLKVFEDKMNNQLKQLFRPTLNSDEQLRARFITNETLNERITRAYSRRSPLLKKKPLILLPRSFLENRMKISNIIGHCKNKSLPPVIEHKSEITNAYKSLPAQRKKTKDEILLPILSTVGSHEHRSKVYKYK